MAAHIKINTLFFLTLVVIIANPCLSDVINTFKKDAFGYLKGIGETCKKWWTLKHPESNYKQSTQFASVFMLATTEVQTHKIKLNCLKELKEEMVSQLENFNKEDPKKILKKACDLTTRIIYTTEKSVGNDKTVTTTGVLSSENAFVEGRHTEDEIYDYLKKQGANYRFEIFKQCDSFAQKDEELYKNYYEKGKKKLEDESFDFYLYSFNSPCDDCLKLTKDFASGNTAKDIGINKVLISYNLLYEGSSPEEIDKLQPEDNIEYWVNDMQLEEIKKKRKKNSNE